MFGKKQLFFLFLGVMLCFCACSSESTVTEIKPEVVEEKAIFSLTLAEAQKFQQRVGAGHDHSLVLTEDGRVVAWGNVIVPRATGVVAVTAGYDHHDLFLQADGSVVVWGVCL